jgi:hypothetical protein
MAQAIGRGGFQLRLLVVSVGRLHGC